MKRFESYRAAEHYCLNEIINGQNYVTSTTFERFGLGFILTNPMNNRNDRSNYEYADKFFEWLLTGEKQLSEEIIKLNPWVARFVDDTGLPENFSSSYGWKIKEQLYKVFEELGKNKESRRGYLHILQPNDDIIRTTDTTHEYPCTIGLHFFIRAERLHLMVNMRSQNVYKVMPYDVYNFAMLQEHVSRCIDVPLGWYYHSINSAHVFKGDARRWLSLQQPVESNRFPTSNH